MYWAIFFLLVLVIVLFAYLVAKEKLSPGAVKIINLILFFISVYLGYLIYDSITGPVRFNQVKKERYAKVISRLKDIRDSEVAFRSVTGDYTASFDSLVHFVDTAKFTITQRRDSVIKVYNEYLGITEDKEIVVIDTLGFIPVKDSIFKGSDRYREMQWVPIPGRDHEVKFELKKSKLKKGRSVCARIYGPRTQKRSFIRPT